MKNFKCKNCSFATYAKKYLNEHKLSKCPSLPQRKIFNKNFNEENSEFKCPDCDFTCSKERFLRNHFRRMHGGLLPGSVMTVVEFHTASDEIQYCFTP